MNACGAAGARPRPRLARALTYVGGFGLGLVGGWFLVIGARGVRPSRLIATTNYLFTGPCSHPEMTEQVEGMAKP